MTDDRKSGNQVWWIIGLVLVLLLVLCLCVSCVVAAGVASFFTTRSSAASFEYGVPERVVTVEVQPEPTLQSEEPDFRMQSGAIILSIKSGSPADGAGWGPGDIITGVDGRSLGSNYDLRQALSGKQPGDMVTFDWWNRQTREAQTVRLQLDSNPDESSSAYLGIEYRMLP